MGRVIHTIDYFDKVNIRPSILIGQALLYISGIDLLGIELATGNNIASLPGIPVLEMVAILAGYQIY